MFSLAVKDQEKVELVGYTTCNGCPGGMSNMRLKR